ncbi:hypothetical protein ACPB9E_17485 [Streptomyces exfoliatus]|uniref:hypothetical protein n=1 Tax=Streptomyces exfoliatus TaxID=1905 RepID=UPI003C2ED8DF
MSKRDELGQVEEGPGDHRLPVFLPRLPTARFRAGPRGGGPELLDGVCTASGCVFVPIELLLESYDGRSVLEQMYAEPLLAALAAEQGWDDDEDLIPVWFDRFFQYM